MVYVTQAYPGMKPYLKGFHLSLETWQGGRDEEGKKVPAKATQAGVIEEEGPAAMSNVKLLLLTQTTAGWDVFAPAPPAGFTFLAPWLKAGPQGVVVSGGKGTTSQALHQEHPGPHNLLELW
jgi:hypothetical protein